jgi:hypothetical protein
VTSFKPDGFRALSTALGACADAVAVHGGTPLERTDLRTWHPQPAVAYELFRTEWAGQLHAIATELRALAEAAQTMADKLTQGDEEFGAALAPSP